MPFTVWVSCISTLAATELLTANNSSSLAPALCTEKYTAPTCAAGGVGRAQACETWISAAAAHCGSAAASIRTARNLKWLKRICAVYLAASKPPAPLRALVTVAVQNSDDDGGKKTVDAEQIPAPALQPATQPLQRGQSGNKRNHSTQHAQGRHRTQSRTTAFMRCLHQAQNLASNYKRCQHHG